MDRFEYSSRTGWFLSTKRSHSFIFHAFGKEVYGYLLRHSCDYVSKPKLTCRFETRICYEYQSLHASILALLTSSTLLLGCSRLQFVHSPPPQLRYSKVPTRYSLLFSLPRRYIPSLGQSVFSLCSGVLHMLFSVIYRADISMVSLLRPSLQSAWGFSLWPKQELNSYQVHALLRNWGTLKQSGVKVFSPKASQGEGVANTSATSGRPRGTSLVSDFCIRPPLDHVTHADQPGLLSLPVGAESGSVGGFAGRAPGGWSIEAVWAAASSAMETVQLRNPPRR